MIEWIEENSLAIRIGNIGNIEEDEDGDFLHLGARGHTVIHYMIRDGKISDWNDRIEVKEM